MNMRLRGQTITMFDGETDQPIRIRYCSACGGPCEYEYYPGPKRKGRPNGCFGGAGRNQR